LKLLIIKYLFNNKFLVLRKLLFSIFAQNIILMSTFSENLKGEKFNFQIPIFETKESNSSLKTSDSITTNSNIKQIKNVSFKKDLYFSISVLFER
jgi:hypothetical protein